MNVISWLFWCLVAVLSFGRIKAGGGGGSHHVKFIIKYPVKTIKHTHTIYKTIHHDHGHEGGGGGGSSLGHSHGGVPKSWDHGWH